MSIKHLSSGFIILAIICECSTMKAQYYPAMLSDGKHFVNVGVNANPIINFNADYGYRSNKIRLANNPLICITQLNFPLFTNKGFDFDIKTGVGNLVTLNHHFKTLVGTAITFSRTSDIDASFFNIGFKLDLYPGYYGKKWMLTPHLSWQYRPDVHIRHKDYAKNAFNDLYTQGTPGTFAAPKDGWFRQNSHILQSGLSVSYIRKQWNVNVTGGFQYIPNKLGIVMFADVGIIPFYGGLNFTHTIPATNVDQ